MCFVFLRSEAFWNWRWRIGILRGICYKLNCAVFLEMWELYLNLVPGMLNRENIPANRQFLILKQFCETEVLHLQKKLNCCGRRKTGHKHQ